MNRIELAEFIATAAHAGQTRWDGIEPYIKHPARVAERVARMCGDSWTVQVAWLHDVIEDTDLTAKDLLALGFHPTVVTTVEAVTRTGGETYRAFILRIAEGSDIRAKLVKIADIGDNLSTLPPRHSMRARYEPAHAVLRASL